MWQLSPNFVRHLHIYIAFAIMLWCTAIEDQSVSVWCDVVTLRSTVGQSVSVWCDVATLRSTEGQSVSVWCDVATLRSTEGQSVSVWCDVM